MSRQSSHGQSMFDDIRSWASDVWQVWDRFLFTPSDPATLGFIRILAGGMLLYTHFVWMLDLEGFFGASGLLSKDFVYRYHDSAFAWSHLYWIENTTVLWVTHVLALAVFACMMAGYQSRAAAIVSALLTISYANRASGALFGLDQINGFLALYLAVGPCGDAYSVDAWLARRRGRPPRAASVSGNIAIRLMQCHLCVVYLFAGCGKLLGQSWWEGTAFWGAVANYEYQTVDLTWMANHMWIIELITHVTIIWEVGYAFLIWPRLSRPVMLLLAVPLHLGIALCMGMVTFGVMMLVANLAFVRPELIRRILPREAPRMNRATSAIRSNAPPPKLRAARQNRGSRV